MLKNYPMGEKRYTMLISLIILSCCFTTIVFGQGNGDALGFQGISCDSPNNAKAVALGSALTAYDNGIEALYHNPAGLVGLERISIQYSGRMAKWHQREYQFWTESRKHPLLPALLDGRYVMDPRLNGVEIDSVIQTLNPDEYSIPVMGKDPFSKDAADWQEDYQLTSPVSSIAVAVPFKLMNRRITLGASYQLSYDAYDFDRNNTNLSPHFGDRTNPLIIESADSLVMQWFRYSRERTDPLYEMNLALAFELWKGLRIGLGYASVSGETSDFIDMQKVGDVLWINAGNYSFSYDTLDYRIEGSSTFEESRFKLGFQWAFDKFTFGASSTLPHELSRSWSYSVDSLSSDTSISNQFTGNDILQLPTTTRLGINIQTSERLSLYFDGGYNPYSQATFDYSDQIFEGDTTRLTWVDQINFNLGFAYRIINPLTIMAGYQSQPQVFIPNRAAFREKGPEMEGFSTGFSYELPWARLDAAYLFRNLKYYDSWESNLNYVTKTEKHLLLGVTVTL